MIYVWAGLPALKQKKRTGNGESELMDFVLQDSSAIIILVLFIILLFIKKVEPFSIEPNGINSFDKIVFQNKYEDKIEATNFFNNINEDCLSKIKNRNNK